jgi:hypothetical protein
VAAAAGARTVWAARATSDLRRAAVFFFSTPLLAWTGAQRSWRACERIRKARAALSIAL